MSEPITDQEWIEAAKRLYVDDECEIDDIDIDGKPVKLSKAEDNSGCWVQAWVWVSIYDVRPDDE